MAEILDPYPLLTARSPKRRKDPYRIQVDITGVVYPSRQVRLRYTNYDEEDYDEDDWPRHYHVTVWLPHLVALHYTTTTVKRRRVTVGLELYAVTELPQNDDVILRLPPFPHLYANGTACLPEGGGTRASTTQSAFAHNFEEVNYFLTTGFRYYDYHEGENLPPGIRPRGFNAHEVQANLRRWAKLDQAGVIALEYPLPRNPANGRVPLTLGAHLADHYHHPAKVSVVKRGTVMG